MARKATDDNQALREFMRRVWREDVTPLLRGKRAAQRQKSAKVSGKVAAATGLFVDTLFRLKGKPFTRAMTVMGSSLGAMLPDVWDWKWFRESANPGEQEVVAEQVQQRAQRLPEADALALFGLGETAERTQLKHAWRLMSKRWHPDKAPDEKSRPEYHLRFLAYQAAYERLCRAHEENRLPRRSSE